MPPRDKARRRPLAWLTWPYWLMVVLALLVAVSPRAASPLVADPPVIASDDFESDSYSGGDGWANNWNISTAVAIVTRERPHRGARHLELRGSAIASRAVGITGWTDVELGFRAKARSLEKGDVVTAEVSFGGQPWQVLETWGEGDDKDRYNLYEYNLSDIATADTVYLRFLSRMDEPSDHFYLDNIEIKGELVPSDPPPPSNPPLLRGDDRGVVVPVSQVVTVLPATSGGGITIDGAFADWAGFPNIPDPSGDATKARGDISAFYWGNNGGAETNYWMIERYPATADPKEEDDEDDEDEDDDGGGSGNSLVKKVKYTIYIDTDNDGDFNGRKDRRVRVDYYPKANHSEVRVKVKSGRGGQTLYSAEGDWGESVAEGGRRVEVAAFWSDLGINNGDVIRMYVESDRDDRAPDSGDIQWSPASILGFWVLGTAVAVGGVAFWHMRKRREMACRSGSE